MRLDDTMANHTQFAARFPRFSMLRTNGPTRNQKQVKGASKKVRSNGDAKSFFHLRSRSYTPFFDASPGRD